MRENEKSQFDNWNTTDDSHVTLENPVASIGLGHLELYLADPEDAFDGLGIAIKSELPESIIHAFQKCEEQGDNLHVQLVTRGKRHDFVLTHRPEAGRYPWRLKLKI